MKTTHRSYSEEKGDFRCLCRFVVETHPFIRTHSTWCLGRIVDWKYGLFENKLAFPVFCEQNAHLWFDAFDRLAGFVISESGGSGIAILTGPGYRFLFGEMLAWALEAWTERGPRFSIEITENQALEARALEQVGFRRKSEFYTRTFDLAQEPAPRFPLEEGFVIIDMASQPDYRGQRILRANAFSGLKDPTEEQIDFQLRFYNHSIQGPIYHPETDLCVMAPDGRLVAGCEALIDARNAEADIERICTHSDFRQRGFARAVIQECLQRLRGMGLLRAYITGYSPQAVALYGSLGAQEEMKSYVYENGG